MSTGTTTIDHAAHVAAGVAFLDKHDPDWWREDADRAIDLETLDLGSEVRCVLGQRCPLDVLAAYSRREWDSSPDPDDGFRAYAEVLSGGLQGAEEDIWAYEHGFTRPPGSLGQWEEWPLLTAEWRKVISERREAVKAGAA